MTINKLNSSLKRRKIFGEVWSMEEKKNRKGKGGKYLEKENIWSAEEQRMEKEEQEIFGQGRRKANNERGQNICGRKIFGHQRKRTTETKIFVD